MESDNEVFELSKTFALRIIKLYQYLSTEKKEFVMSKQVLRCGTSIGANISEALVAQSRADFISKLHIALKECNETNYWIELLCLSDYITTQEFQSLQKDCVSLLRLLTAIIKSSKKHTQFCN